jgi:putative ABC transport system permease protein
MMVSLAIMIGSFRKTVMVWIDQTLKADLWVQTAARAQGSSLARMPATIVSEIAKLPNVIAVDGFVEHAITYNGDPTNIAGADLNVVAQYGHLIFTNGEDGRQICGSLGPNDAIVTEAFAIRKHVHKGDQLQLSTPTGAVNLNVRGIYYDYASDLGYIVVPRASYARIFNDDKLSSCVVYIKPEAKPDSVRADILRTIGTSASLKIRTTRELRTEALKIFDRTFAITYALHTIAIAVALLSVMNALFALTMESKREFGILRYVGASEKQLRRIVLIEAGILGAIGNGAGLVLGFLLSLLLIYVVNRQSFGWTVQLSLPLDFLAVSGLLVFATALIAGLIPARMAARTLAPSVVRDE